MLCFSSEPFLIFHIRVCVCLLRAHVCPRDNLKTMADICFLIGSYVDWRKILDEFACQGRSRFSVGSRSLSKVIVENT